MNFVFVCGRTMQFFNWCYRLRERYFFCLRSRASFGLHLPHTKCADKEKIIAIFTVLWVWRCSIYRQTYGPLSTLAARNRNNLSAINIGAAHRGIPNRPKKEQRIKPMRNLSTGNSIVTEMKRLSSFAPRIFEHAINFYCIVFECDWSTNEKFSSIGCSLFCLKIIDDNSSKAKIKCAHVAPANLISKTVSLIFHYYFVTIIQLKWRFNCERIQYFRSSISLSFSIRLFSTDKRQEKHVTFQHIRIIVYLFTSFETNPLIVLTFVRSTKR